MPKRLTREEFIEKAIKIHGDTYDYSLVEYVNSNTKVKIICKIHGVFEQKPTIHLDRSGCTKCGLTILKYNQRKDTQYFIKKSMEIHGNKYDYSLSNYETCDIPVSIICPVHGVFLQTPNVHTSGHGCLRCGRLSIYGMKEFVENAINTHGNKYNYSEVMYIDCFTKVKIICPEHGIFMQNPTRHLQGRGCNKCACKINGNRQRKGVTRFIKEATEIHGNKYDYSKVDYKTCETKISVICPNHGLFLQIVKDHLHGHGCPECAGVKKSNTEEFIKKAKIKHSSFYDYVKVQYINTCTKITITCPIHGDFNQNPSDHLNGTGCVKCGDIRTGKKIRLTQEEFINRCINKHGNKYDYSQTIYEKCGICVKIICSKHGVFEQLPENHMKGAGCPSCKESKGEISVNSYLQNRNLYFIRQHKFVDCINPKTGRKLFFDFFVPSYNLCIEFDGTQHYQPHDIFGGKEDFEIRQYLDSIKTQYCLDNNINLLRIHYKDLKNIPSILEDYFSIHPPAN